MLKKSRRMKVVGLLATGAMIYQFGGCLGGVFQRAGIGFAEALGAVPAGIVNDLFIQPLIDGFLDTDGDDTGG